MVMVVSGGGATLTNRGRTACSPATHGMSLRTVLALVGGYAPGLRGMVVCGGVEVRRCGRVWRCGGGCTCVVVCVCVCVVVCVVVCVEVGIRVWRCICVQEVVVCGGGCACV